jgi:uncharacterized protein YjbI with pentapeptide repeats
MLTEQADFDRDADLTMSLVEDGIFQWCNFTGLNIEGPTFDGTLIGCVFARVEWYFSLFNCTNFLSTRFVNCTFLGCSFATCRLIECKFEDCRFDLDNLGGPCSFEECLLVETSFDRCHLILQNPHNHPVFVGNRSYRCAQKECVGFDGLFHGSEE